MPLFECIMWKQIDKIGIKQVIVGKAIYEGKISLKEIEHLNLT